jgi:hypothetical protein
MSSATAVPQSDNIAHALSGAGGGLLSMTLTYAFSSPIIVTKRSIMFTNNLPVTLSSLSPHAHKLSPSEQTLVSSMQSAALLPEKVLQVSTLASTLPSSASPSQILSTTIGTNGHAQPSRKPPSKRGVPRNGSQPSNR